MKPAPFKKVSHTDSEHSLRVTSDPDTEKTIVYAPNGSILWSLDIYIGRKKIQLSPDGQTLMLIGNKYFGGTLSTNTESHVFEVYTKDGLKTAYNFKDFFGMSIDSALQTFDISQRGGGWFSMMSYIHIETITWKDGLLEMIFQNGRRRVISF